MSADIKIETVSYEDATIGRLWAKGGFQCFTLELPWLDNEVNVSCIPEGVYIVDRNKTGRHQWYALRNEETDPRTYIEIHPASLLRHLEGCLAPCFEIKGGERTSEPVAVKSSEACSLLLEWFGDDSWALNIRSAG